MTGRVVYTRGNTVAASRDDAKDLAHRRRPQYPLAATLVTAGAGHPDAARAVKSLGSLAVGTTLVSFHREHEVEADLIGLQILTAADYDPCEAVKVMEKFIALRNVSGAFVSLFSTHPDPEVRLVNVQHWLGSLGEIDYAKRVVTTQAFIEFTDIYQY